VREKAPRARVQGISVQEMVIGGAELIVGCSSDPEFGPILMVGAGGIWAELLGDVAFRALPVGHDDVRAMIEGLAIHPMLAGARGRPALDVDAAADTIARIAAAFAGAEGIAEVDVNPLIVLPRGQGVCAVDTLIVPSAAKSGGQAVSGEIPHHQADRVRDANREEI
jgi:acyl-CoA synthetase (NDP forming)